MSPAIRRVLQRRDGGCRFPGCSATRFVDAHHIHHWADGGETHLGNLVLLCRHHHRLVHEGGFGLDIDLAVSLPGVPKADAEALVAKAHHVCPYSNATRGNVDVRLSVV